MRYDLNPSAQFSGSLSHIFKKNHDGKKTKFKKTIQKEEENKGKNERENSCQKLNRAATHNAIKKRKL